MAFEVITISDEVWQKRVVEWMAATGKNLRSALDEEWPLLMKKVIQFTPPFKTAGAPGSSDLSVGRAAVRNDIEKTMRPFDPANIRSKRLQAVVEDRDFRAFNIIASRSKDSRLAGSVAAPFDPAFHLNARDARGRVKQKRKPVVMLGGDAARLQSYITSVQDRVGWAKSGWAAAFNLVKDPEGWSLPAYVEKQGTSGGLVIDERDAEDPSLTAINRTSWSIRKEEGERIKADALFSRIVSITSKIRTYMRLAAKEAGLDQKPA
jgi:hypothetical protein